MFSSSPRQRHEVSRSGAVPFLRNGDFRGDSKHLFTDPYRVEIVMDSIITKDISLFHREILLKHDEGATFVQKSVKPVIILYPGTGTRGLMWQEMDARDKKSPGRIVLPVFLNGSLEKSLPLLTGEYRWELQKSVAGVDWTDPVKGGMAGAYYDYIKFYKQNPNLNSEARARVADLIRNTKSDRERFVRECLLWIEYESRGMLRLNPVSREILYRFCHFPASVREQLAKMPAYVDLEERFRNRRRQDILRIRRKVNAMRKNGDVVPEDLTEGRPFQEISERYCPGVVPNHRRKAR